MIRSLAQAYDVALLDLDGTVYLGGTVIDFVPQALVAARAAGMVTVFVSNNASRPPAVVAQSLQQMGIAADGNDVLTSPHAAAQMLAAAHPAGSNVLVIGAPYLSEAIRDVGLSPVGTADDEPVAVVQGHSPDTGWRELAEACIAIRSGADWVACNTDSTLPTDRGLLPGNGALVAALVTATGLQPRVAGKPARPLLDSAIERSGAQRPLVVGDRLDTDIEAAVAAGLPALMPLTGVNNAADLLTAPVQRRPTYVCLDLRGLTEPSRVVRVPQAGQTAEAFCGTENNCWTVIRHRDRLTLSTADQSNPDDDAQVLFALFALLVVAWHSPLADGKVWSVAAADAAAGAALRRLMIPQN